MSEFRRLPVLQLGRQEAAGAGPHRTMPLLPAGEGGPGGSADMVETKHRDPGRGIDSRWGGGKETSIPGPCGGCQARRAPGQALGERRAGPGPLSRAQNNGAGAVLGVPCGRADFPGSATGPAGTTINGWIPRRENHLEDGIFVTGSVPRRLKFVHGKSVLRISRANTRNLVEQDSRGAAIRLSCQRARGVGTPREWMKECGRVRAGAKDRAHAAPQPATGCPAEEKVLLNIPGFESLGWPRGHGGAASGGGRTSPAAATQPRAGASQESRGGFPGPVRGIE